MDREQALATWNELREWAREEPGDNPGAIECAKKARINFSYDPNYNSYLGEKMLAVVGHFETWFSPRKWQRWDYDHLKGIMLADLQKLKSAIQSAYPPA
jgi:hypothetical protein